MRLGLEVPTDELSERIARRVQRMWQQGFVEEVRALPELATTRTASRALGYSQILRFLAGVISEDEAMEATVVATRRFAKRQLTWFRRDRRVRWLPYDDPNLVERARELIASTAPE